MRINDKEVPVLQKEEAAQPEVPGTKIDYADRPASRILEDLIEAVRKDDVKTMRAIGKKYFPD